MIINNSDYEYYYSLNQGINLLDESEISGGIVVTTKTAVAILVK